MRENYNLFMERICNRIVFLLAVNLKIEVLKMNAEFSIDDNRKMWLVGVEKLYIRRLNLN